jgi:hypothetical protein
MSGVGYDVITRKFFRSIAPADGVRERRRYFSISKAAESNNFQQADKPPSNLWLSHEPSTVEQYFLAKCRR